MFRRLLWWLDRRSARYLANRTGTGDMIRPLSQIARPTPATVAKLLADRCPCGAGWHHNQPGDRAAHTAWLREGI